MTSEKGRLVYSCELAVRWGDMDAYGHVNNALYMRYLEEARVQLIAEMGVPMDPEGLAPVVINVGCTFIKAVVYPDTLRIDCYVGSPGRSSFMTHYEVFSSNDDTIPVAEGYAKVVWIDHRTEKSVSLPAKVRSFLE